MTDLAPSSTLALMAGIRRRNAPALYAFGLVERGIGAAVAEMAADRARLRRLAARLAPTPGSFRHHAIEAHGPLEFPYDMEGPSNAA